MRSTVPADVIEQIIETDHPDPFQVLGQHAVEVDGIPSWTVRAFQPQTREVVLIDETGGQELPMARCHDAGFFEVLFHGRTEPLRYHLRVTDYEGGVRTFRDSYAFLPSLHLGDLGLFNEGRNYKVYETLGAHVLEHQGVRGVRFAVWAPSARAVSVIGSFNSWDRRRHSMRRLGTSGVWEIFVPGLSAGAVYKYKIRTQQGPWVDKTDPFAFRTEIAPQTASLVHDMEGYSWGDEAWIAARPSRDPDHAPLSIYEVHVGSWLREPRESEDPPNFREIAPRLVSYVKAMGFTHVELLPVTEHPFGGSWGYQTTGYYAPSSRWGTPEDLMFLIDLCHQAGIGVLLNWVPGHFPKDLSALGRFDGTALFEHLDPRQGEHPDWGTFIFNYGRAEVRNFLIGSALFWLERYHIDGLRIDAVSSMLYLDYNRAPGQWIPNERGGRENLTAIDFLHELNTVLPERFPGVFTCAEESTSWPGVTAPIKRGGLGFTYKWNLGWMHDILRYLSVDPLYRKAHQDKLTFALWYAFSERFILPLSHDEVVHLKKSLLDKMPGDMWQKFANLRLLLSYQAAHPGKKLLFMGGDLGQWTEWNHDVGLQWDLLRYPTHHGVNQLVSDLTHLHGAEAALHEEDFESTGFEWIDFKDAARSIAAFRRKAPTAGEEIIWVFNFTPVPRHGYPIGVDDLGAYKEIFNSDAREYGGSGVGNSGRVESRAGRFGGRPNTLLLTLPPLAAVAFKLDRPAKDTGKEEAKAETKAETKGDEAGGEAPAKEAGAPRKRAAQPKPKGDASEARKKKG